MAERKRKSRQGTKLRRVREHAFMLAAVYCPCCYTCGQAFEPESFVAGDASDGLTWHHIDNNRKNNDPANLALCHRNCHRLFHNAMERGEDIRTAAAVKHWGPTPKNWAPNRTRVSGTILAGNVNLRKKRAPRKTTRRRKAA